MDNDNLYYSFSDYLRKKYGGKVYKLPVEIPVSCPNRKTGAGCAFCAAEGTGFEMTCRHGDVVSQLNAAKERIAGRYHADRFIAYFQNYTNTFLPLKDLLGYMSLAAGFPDIVEIDLSTRPDCVNEEYLSALEGFKERYDLEVSMEYGLQTVNYHTLRALHRGHGLAEYIDAVLRSNAHHLPVCTHMILNLPGDTMEDVRESARILSALPVSMVKIHSLYIPKTSPMASEFTKGNLKICSKEEYLERLAEFVALLRQDIAVERLFSRIPQKDACFCNWGRSWWRLLDEWKDLMKDKGWYQGIHCDYLNGAALGIL
ncbi:MAG: TIGR01212 family radical SAM protein [Eubacterium sp.]|nr:TIGR01212 family radical SAM protein [Eubacterium sp.]